jgi:tripartite-type tricarboxylate transporter receptor subunit TctC
MFLRLCVWINAARKSVLLLAVCASAFCSIAAAQNYPARPIRIISPIPPGSAPDLVARAIGNSLSLGLGQSVVVENKTGSNGELAADFVAHAPADGYTLLVGMDSMFVINPYLYSSRNFDVNTDLIPVATLGSNQFVLAINPDLPVKTLPEFVDWVKRSKVAPAYASVGNGSQHQMMMEIFKARAGIDLLHVPFKGGTAAISAIVSGEVVAMFAGTSNSSLIKAGKLRALAVSGAKRSKAMPEVPTIGEFYPGFDNTIWIGLFAPKGTPVEVLQRLRQEVAKSLRSPSLIETFAKAGGIEPFITSSDEMQRLIKQDQAKYGKIIHDLKIKLD